MKAWFSRWDVTPEEQARLSFGETLTLINLRRLEIGGALGLFTRGVELATAKSIPHIHLQILILAALLAISLFARGRVNQWQARALILVSLLTVTIVTQVAVAALGAQGRLTNAYPYFLLTVTLIFVLPPRIFGLSLLVLFGTYCAIVLQTLTRPVEQVVAMVNTGTISVIAFVAALLIYSGRRNDYEQKRVIRDQMERLRERNVELDMLMAVAAHDLRSPLYGLRNVFGLGLDRAVQQPDLPVRIMGEAMTSIDAMLALVTRLLDAHAAEHAPLGSRAAVDIREAIGEAARRMQPLAGSSDVRIVLHLGEAPLIARLDSGAFGQILDNLMGNAIRYSPDGGKVSVTTAHDPGLVTVTVRDQGPGIRGVEAEGLFRKFARGRAPDRDNKVGAGMGLFIVATLAARMGIDVQHVAEDRDGACFRLSIPTMR